MSGFSQKDEKFRHYALSAHPMKLLLTVCMPLALYHALQTVFRLLDTLMASHISSDAVSAVAALSQITLMLNALGTGLSVGGSIKISEAYGEGNDELVRRRVSTVYAMAILVSLAAAATLIPFAPAFLHLLGTPEDLIVTGVGYFRVEVLTLVITFFNTVYLAIERSRGHTRKILVLNLCVITIKLVLSAFFIYVIKGGLILMALATLAGQILLLSYALISGRKDEGAFRFSLHNIHFKKETVLPILNLSYPVAAENVLFSAGKVIVNSMSGIYGSLTVGALSISNNIAGLTNSWHTGLSDGTSPLISQNRGAKQYRRTLQIYYSLLLINTVIGVLGLIIISPCMDRLAEIFALSQNHFDTEFRDMIISIHKWEMVAYITLGINAATVALLLGYGYTKLTLILNVTRVFVFRVPVLWAFQHHTNLGAEAVGLTMMISNVCTGIMAIAIAIPVVRKIRKLIREEETQNEIERRPV